MADILLTPLSLIDYFIIYFGMSSASSEYGRNLTVIRLPTFGKLVRVGLPNRLRGEIWEYCSGSMYLRFMNQGLYERLHREYAGKTSVSTEEIEKDLNR